MDPRPPATPGALRWALLGLLLALLLAPLEAAPLACGPLWALRLALGRAGPPAGFLGGLVAGLVLSALAARPLGPPPPQPAAGGEVHALEGVVLAADPPGRFGVRVRVETTHVGEGPDRRPLALVIDLAVPSGLRLALGPGDRIRVRARLEPPRPRPGLPPPDLQARVPDARALRLLARGRGPAAWIAGRRAAGTRALDAALGGDDAGLARALVLGDRSTLSAADRHRFRVSGQGHLVAVSGLHVGLLLATLLVLLRRLGARPGFVLAAGVLACALYVPLAGSPPSALRAGLGISLFLGGRLVGREPATGWLLGVVALGVLLAHPPNAESVSFRLSFAAVLGIVLLAARIRDALVPRVPRIPGLLEPPRAPFRRALSVSLAAWLATAPLILLHLGRICLVAAPVAVLAVPLAALLVASAFGIVLLGALPGVAVPLAAAFALVADLLRALLAAVEDVGLGARPAAHPTPLWLLAYGAAFGLAARARGRLAAAGALGLAGLLALAVLGPPDEGQPVPRPATAAGEYDPPPMLAAGAPRLLDLDTGLVLAGLGAFAVLAWRPLRWLEPLAGTFAALLGGLAWMAFGAAGLAALFAPFLGANLLGRLPGGPDEGARRARQVVANGLGAALGTALALLGWPAAGAAFFLGSLAALGGDTCATEVGVRYGGPPRHALSGRHLARGESGGVTPAGLAASVLGAALAPVAFHLACPLAAATLGLTVLAGVAGAWLDSVLGATLQYRGVEPGSGRTTERRTVDGLPTQHVSGLRWLDNDAVNLVAGLAGGVLAWLLAAR